MHSPKRLSWIATSSNDMRRHCFYSCRDKLFPAWAIGFISNSSKNIFYEFVISHKISKRVIDIFMKFYMLLIL